MKPVGVGRMMSKGALGPEASAERRGATRTQIAVLIALGVAGAAMAAFAPGPLGDALVLGLQLGFLVCAAWRVLLVVVAFRLPAPPGASLAAWPRYTIMAALHDEAEVVAQLIERLAEIDYPRGRLECFLLLEAHDLETIDAAMAAEKPDWMRVLIVPAGTPRTKPRALNHGLAHATGDLITIYDAEDDPDPLQLREAAGRFSADSSHQLACLQAPLRIRTRRERVPGGAFLDRQFAAEYAALFEITLPAMARLGLPFPLGGTSNHFRTEVLRRVGGWDAWNVTEDADLGFRLWRQGWRMGVMSRPTYETPPGGLDVWLPQRTRWLKGYMQTWGVHTRGPAGLGWRGGLSLVMTIGVTLVSAPLHALSLAWITASILMAVAAQVPPTTPLFAISVLVLGAAAAWLVGLIGARRAHVPYTAADMIVAPAYWSLLSLAFFHALWRLVREPHAWNKTRHRREPDEVEAAGEARSLPAAADPERMERVDAGREAA